MLVNTKSGGSFFLKKEVEFEKEVWRQQKHDKLPSRLRSMESILKIYTR